MCARGDIRKQFLCSDYILIVVHNIDDSDDGVAWNDGQRAVLEHKTGPLLVVAGAGTGKTRVIVGKINKLLDEGVQPSAILAVTFTEKAAAEMAERVLLSRTGLLPDLPITTFNGYGNAILHEFGVHIGLGSNFQLLSEQAQIVFFRERLNQFELNYFMPLSGMPDGNISNILGFIGRLKQNLVTPEAYHHYAAALPSTDEAEAEEKRMHVELAGIYSKYIELCRTDNFIDYDDQIYLTIQLLEQRPNIRKTLQDRYHTIFIDEFQDTNPMQSRLIDLLVNKQRNLIVVGDDDQAIYGFRGATLSNILSFKDRYPDTKEAALTTNYRSHQSILDAAHQLIQHNDPHRLESSLGINKRLISDKPGEEPVLCRFEDTDSELVWIAEDIKRRLSALGEDQEPSIAILTRSNASNQAVHNALDAAGIPHRVVGARPDLYAQPVVRMLLELVRTLVEPENNTSLHHTLISPLFGISNHLIAPLASKASHEHDLLENLLTNVEETRPCLELISSLRAEAASWPVGRLVWRAITDSGYKDTLLKDAMTDDQSAASIGHLKQFFDTLSDFERIATQPTAAQYLLSLPVLKAAGEYVDDTLGITESEVIISTIHKSKGLEWNTVYLPLLMKGSFPYLGGSNSIPLPEALSAGTTSPADERMAEERRLMYVAATRARRTLILSYADRAKSPAPRKPSQFIDEMFGEGTSESTAQLDVLLGQAGLDEPVSPVQKVSPPESILNGHTVRLSASQAATILECPLNFYYRYILRTPEEPKPSTGYGSLMHSLFQQINQGRKENNMPTLASLKEQLNTSWQKTGYSTLEQQQRAHRQAHKTLERFYSQTEQSPPPLQVEHDFEVMLDESDIILHGRMDVVLDDNGVEIRDYKTGLNGYDVKTVKGKASASDQLAVYALAWQIQNGQLPARVALHYVDDDVVGAVSKQAKSFITLQAKLSEAAENIRSGKYQPKGEHRFCIHP